MENIIPFMPKKRIVPSVAYQVDEKDGGFQLYQITLDEKGNFVKRDKVSSPDGWEQVITLLERELSRNFA
jgi:hypothetical protein